MIGTDVLVIGAGLAGLTLSHHLVDHGAHVTLIEKSGAPGGRLSTRRSDFGSFDHGAQYLTGRTPAFTALINHLAQDGDIAAWKPRGKDSARPWWVGQPGMSTIGKVLARDLGPRFGVRATGISCRDGRCDVQVEHSDGTQTHFSARRVVAAIPAPQALELLGSLDPVFTALEKVRMAPCWTAMLAFETPLGDEVQDLIRGHDGDALALIARNGSKPGRSGETFVLHAAPDWSRARLGSDRESVASAMLDALRAQTGLGADLPVPVHVDLHRWLHALVETPLDRPFIGNADNTLFACGDWCLEARAEAAHQSGLALADHIISL
ncbi:MAG: FAD-dependent oxidoreductase [Hoeflea sp.]|uniref:NAD(P)/FAD-dependent oxidoreductase n=1 Tax=Hoeflea sp. TaxID=1940281 RepID=UPI001D9A206F|nr:FAD-dependent oxidoreductase [Hoeflea sp.]MBU4528184.1 FAD-dependent oxidoreductase [Alphaproteobacteria bacterium]MBU4543780.1 FAD-dependent oxidoreductase [Alphaproteobacteria bacterium]MBU4548647.1 FAD-dependent oxidoreductase [Alphaproteobacteria bacterium]MBV1725813.1 FAD-dependent oxidoreductase [Hoeflea sp.]MBV1762169.1 FAD-dependent oxidoreductase [Hoeflea sp.]